MQSTEIYYYCPRTTIQSAGIRRLYRHVSLLRQSGFHAFILHSEKGPPPKDVPDVPTRTLGDAIGSHAVFVIPEGFPNIMAALKGHPGRRFVIALNWDYVFKVMAQVTDWLAFNIEQVLVISPGVGKMITWSMGLPVHTLSSGINHHLYAYEPELKQPQVAFIQRKATHIDQIKRLLGARNTDYIHKIKWVGLDGLAEPEYATEIRRSTVFVNMSLAEGYPTSCMEAMAAGTMVVGYDSLGGRDILRCHGPEPNCLLAQAGDYLSLAYALEPVLKDLVHDTLDNWRPMITNALETAAAVTPEGERTSLISFWRKACPRA